jgi:uncharacterized RDD family membrane protein YckC
MPCSICGDICRCSSDSESLSNCPPDTQVLAATSRCSEDAAALDAACMQSTPDDCPDDKDENNVSISGTSPAWRQEVSTRLNRYHARRKPRPPRYPSLRLRFEQEASAPPIPSIETRLPPQAMVTASHQALALDGFIAETVSAAEPPQRESLFHLNAPEVASPARDTSVSSSPSQHTAKIIEFPRFWTPPPPAPDQLADPVFDRPRILEAPEIVPPPPALGGITIEPAKKPDICKLPGIDIPLNSAGLLRRICSAVIDVLTIAAACGLFGFIFWKLTAIRPPRLQIVCVAGGLFCLFWAVYQYLLIVYSGTTPGLRLARLRLSRFDGSPAPRSLRRWRILASFLSAASLGMGYVWVFLDEDVLCWHDRITRTYLAPIARTTSTPSKLGAS